MDKELIKKIEKALGYKLYIATIRYLETEDAYMWSGRCCGKTIAYILKIVLQKDKTIEWIDVINGSLTDEVHDSPYRRWFLHEFKRIRDLLKAEGMEVVKIV